MPDCTLSFPSMSLLTSYTVIHQDDTAMSRHQLRKLPTIAHTGQGLGPGSGRGLQARCAARCQSSRRRSRCTRAAQGRIGRAAASAAAPAWAAPLPPEQLSSLPAAAWDPKSTYCRYLTVIAVYPDQLMFLICQNEHRRCHICHSSQLQQPVCLTRGYGARLVRPSLQMLRQGFSTPCEDIRYLQRLVP